MKLIISGNEHICAGYKFTGTELRLYDNAGAATNIFSLFSLSDVVVMESNSITVDDIPTADSSNPVKSGGVATTLDTKVDKPAAAKDHRMLYFTGTGYEWVHPSKVGELAKTAYFKVGAGRFNMSWSNATGRKWTFPAGTVLYSDGTTACLTSTDEKPDVVIPEGGGVVTLTTAAWAGSHSLLANDTGAVLLCDLSDLPVLTHTLNFASCTNVKGVPMVNGDDIPTTTDLSGTGMTATDIDNTLIAYAACSKASGTFTATGKTRTAASDEAVIALTAAGWTISGITKE